MLYSKNNYTEIVPYFFNINILQGSLYTFFSIYIYFMILDTLLFYLINIFFYFILFYSNEFTKQILSNLHLIFVTQFSLNN